MNLQPAETLIDRLVELDVKLWLEDGVLKCSAPKGALSPELRNEIAARKRELTELLERASSRSKTGNCIPVRVPGEAAPLTRGQERICALATLEPQSSVYNVPLVFRITGSLYVDVLERALSELARRHESLRTVFDLDVDRKGCQRVCGTTSVLLSVTDLGRDLDKMPAAHRASAVDRVVQHEVCLPFELERGPLWRAHLFRLERRRKGGSESHRHRWLRRLGARLGLIRIDPPPQPESSILAFTLHHIIFDGASKSIFLGELSEIYRALLEDEPPSLEALRIQFGDYAKWQADRVDAVESKRQLSYWRSRLAVPIAPLHTPNDFPRSAGKGKAGVAVFSLVPTVAGQLVEFANAERASPFIVVLAAFMLVMHRYSGQEDLLVCSPTGSREHPDVEPLIGYFNNVVVLRANVAGEISFRGFVGHVRGRALEAYDNQHVPLQDLAGLPGLSRVPLTRAMVSYQARSARKLPLHGVTAEPVPIRRGTADFDLALYLEGGDEGVGGLLEFDEAIFRRETAESIVRGFVETVSVGVATPDFGIDGFGALGVGVDFVKEALLMHRGIDDAYLLRSASTGLVTAYLVLNEHDVPDIEEVRAYLDQTVPRYAVPGILVPMDALPLREGGEIDSSALPDPGRGRERLSSPYVAPRSELERSLVSIWKRVLWLDEDVGVEDDFTELGGHSLLAVQLLAEIERTLGSDVPIGALASLSSVAALAIEIDRARRGECNGASYPPDVRTLPEEVYRGLLSHTATWTGWRAEAGSLIVGLNVTGSRRPLFWCLQRYAELTQLAKYLGEDQPVYGMRSGNRVMVKTQDNIDALAAHYVSEILASGVDGPYFVGGNCQAAKIAFQVASRLRRLGHEVPLLILQEKFVPFPYDGPLVLLFGDNSDRHPAGRFETPGMGWRKYYTGPLAFHEIKGSHGDFFREPNIQVLAQTIRRCLDEATEGRVCQSGMLAFGTHPLEPLPDEAYRAEYSVSNASNEIQSKQDVILYVRVRNTSAAVWPPTEVSGVMLRCRWRSGSKGITSELDGRYALQEPVSPDEWVDFVVKLIAPKSAGSWLLDIDMVDEGVAWFRERGSQAFSLEFNVRK